MNKEKLQQQSVDQIVNGCMKMLSNVDTLRRGLHSEKAIQYVGATYKMHIAELRERRYRVIADYYERQWEARVK